MDRKVFEEELLRGNITEKYLELSKEEIVQRFGDGIANVVDFGDQNNNSHQYELFEHILRTVDSVDTSKMTVEDALKVKIAAFFHDIGKPEVAKLNEKTGQTQYIGHAKESENKAVEILEEMGYDANEVSEIAFLIQIHDDFIPISSKNDVTPDRIAKVFASINKKLDNYKPNINDMKNLLALCRADVMAQSEVIEKNGEVVDTRAARIEKLDAIEEVLPQAIVLKQEQEIEKLENQKSVVIEGPKPIEKKGRIVNQKQIDLWNSKTAEQKESEIADIDTKISELRGEEEFLLGGESLTKKASKIASQESEIESQSNQITSLEEQVKGLEGKTKVK